MRFKKGGEKHRHCDACCLLLIRLRVLDSRIYHRGFEACENHRHKNKNKKYRKSNINFASVAVLHSHLTLLEVAR